MTEKKPDDTRRLLKVFGVAVTDIESEGAELNARIAGLGGEPSDEMLVALGDLLKLVVDTNRKWRDVTDHLMNVETRLLRDAIAAIARKEP